MLFKMKFSVQILAFLFMLTSALSALARTATPAELDQLATTIKDYESALKGNDVDKILTTLPPQLFQQLAKQAHIDESQIHQLVKDQLKQMTSTVTLDEIKIDFAHKRSGELDDGSPYYIIPLELAVTNQDNNKMKLESAFIALLYQNQWYLVRGDNAGFLDVMKTAFPGFEKIVIDPPKIQKLH